MADPVCGVAVPKKFDKERVVSRSNEGAADRRAWQVSPAAQRELEALDQVIRASELRLGGIRLD